MSKTKLLTNEVLKGIMSDAMVTRRTCADFNMCIDTGIWYVDHTTANLPTDAYRYGVLIVIRLFQFCYQVYIPDYSTLVPPYIYRRMVYMRETVVHEYRPWLKERGTFAES